MSLSSRMRRIRFRQHRSRWLRRTICRRWASQRRLWRARRTGACPSSGATGGIEISGHDGPAAGGPTEAGNGRDRSWSYAESRRGPRSCCAQVARGVDGRTEPATQSGEGVSRCRLWRSGWAAPANGRGGRRGDQRSTSRRAADGVARCGSGARHRPPWVSVAETISRPVTTADQRVRDAATPPHPVRQRRGPGPSAFGIGGDNRTDPSVRDHDRMSQSDDPIAAAVALARRTRPTPTLRPAVQDGRRVIGVGGEQSTGAPSENVSTRARHVRRACCVVSAVTNQARPWCGPVRTRTDGASPFLGCRPRGGVGYRRT